MRIAVYILAGLGVLGAGVLGFKYLSDAGSPEGKLSIALADRIVEEGEDKVKESSELVAKAKDVKRAVNSTWFLILASVAGVAGGVFIYLDKILIAAGLMLVPPLIPAIVFPKSLVFTFPLPIAGALAFRITPEDEPRRRKKKRKRDKGEEDEADDEDEAATKRKKKQRQQVETDEDADADDDTAVKVPDKKRRRPQEEEEEQEETPPEDEEEEADEAVESEVIEEPPAPAPVLQVTCPHCKATLKSKTPLPVGKSIKCPKCAKPVRIEPPKKAPVPAPPRSAPKRKPPADEDD